MIDSGITCMVKINSNFWKWTFLFTNDNFQTGSLSEELWQKSIFVFLGQGVITSSSELSTSSDPQPSYSIPPAHPYNIGHTSCSPSIAFGNRNAIISSITTSHSENVRKFWYFFSTKDSYSSLKVFIGSLFYVGSSNQLSSDKQTLWGANFTPLFPSVLHAMNI